MAGYGGRRSRSGCKQGGITQKTREIAERSIAEGLSPLQYMLAVMRDEQADVRRRDEMAKAAAPYVHPRMAPAQPGHPDPDFVPLHERIKEYERAMQASDGKVVEFLPKRLTGVPASAVDANTDVRSEASANASAQNDPHRGVVKHTRDPYADDDDGERQDWMTV
jgi:hypothetical protein